MKKRAKKLILILGILVFLGQSRENFSLLYQKGMEALNNWDFIQAGQVCEKISSLLPGLEDSQKELAHLFLAKYWFYVGDYSASLSELEQIQARDKIGDFPEFYQRVKTLEQTFAQSQEKKNRHFIIRWTDPRDEILVEPSLEVLEQAYQTLTKIFGLEPKREKILVEIYPSPELLATAVGISEDMIINSGTVAICKFGRILITTPRALLYGYDYLTTLSHELVHYFVYSRNGETCPVWLHEGLAKHLERAYQNKSGYLTPVSKSLLVNAIKEQHLITFEQMHPTFAQFEAPGQGELAFAEVSTMVGWLKSGCGNDSWFKILDLLKQGEDDRFALEEICGENFPSIWQDWQKWVLAQGWEVLPGVVALKPEFKKPGEKEEELSPEELGSRDAWEYVRLGDLLRDRGNYRSAVVEYEKAVKLEPYHPKILNKLGLARIMAGDFAGAVKVLEKSTWINPGYSSTYVNLGLAYLGLGEEEKAITSFKRASELNPFNPLPYHKLREIYLKQGDEYNAEKMAENLEIIKRKGG